MCIMGGGREGLRGAVSRPDVRMRASTTDVAFNIYDPTSIGENVE